MAPSWTWQASRVVERGSLRIRSVYAAKQSLQSGLASVCHSEKRSASSIRNIGRLSPGSEASENFHGYALYVLYRVVVRRNSRHSGDRANILPAISELQLQ